MRVAIVGIMSLVAAWRNIMISPLFHGRIPTATLREEFRQELEGGLLGELEEAQRKQTQSQYEPKHPHGITIVRVVSRTHGHFTPCPTLSEWHHQRA